MGRLYEVSFEKAVVKRRLSEVTDSTDLPTTYIRHQSIQYKMRHFAEFKNIKQT